MGATKMVGDSARNELSFVSTRGHESMRKFVTCSR